MRLLAILFLPLTIDLYSQSDSTGVYLSYRDYQNKKLSFAGSCESESHKIRIRDWWPLPSIVVRNDDRKVKLMKYEIYGYRDCSKQDHRFFANEDLEMINTDGLFLYRQLQDFRQGEIEVQRYVYFFSKSGESWVHPLCKRELKWAYRRNSLFINSVDSLFRTDEDLNSIDQESKEYNLIKVYFQSLGKD